MLPALDYKKIGLAVLILVVGLGMIAGIFWLVFLQPNGGIGEKDENISGNGGNLPGTGDFEHGQTIVPGGNLPDSGQNGAFLDGMGSHGETDGKMKIDMQAKGSYTQINTLIDTPSKGLARSQRGFNFLNLADNKFYRMVDGEDELILLSEKTFPNVDTVIWSPDGKKVFAEYPDGSNIVYDFNTNKQVTLPKGAEDLSWEEGSNLIAYKYIGNSSEDNWLVVADFDGKNSVAVEPMGDQDYGVQVSWSPSGQIVALYHKAIGVNREEVFFIGLNDDNLKSLTVEGSNFKGMWSPKGDKILYHVISDNNNYNPVLWISDAAINSIGNNNFSLGITTWVDKCVFWDNKTVYCAVPISLPEGSGMFPDEINDSGDVFYRIDLSTGLSKMIAYPILSDRLDKFQVDALLIDGNGDRLYFRDAFSEGVYYLEL